MDPAGGRHESEKPVAHKLWIFVDVQGLTEDCAQISDEFSPGENNFSVGTTRFTSRKSMRKADCEACAAADCVKVAMQVDGPLFDLSG